MIDLYDWQIPSRDKLAGILQTKDIALDQSATGTGKTYVALAVARALDKVPLIIAPKAAITGWKRVSEAMGVPVLGVYNVEQVKLGNTPHASPVGKKLFRWNLPAGSLVIFDEVHKFGGIKTANAGLLACTKQYKIKSLCLSATLTDQGPLGLRAVGYLLGLHRFHVNDFYPWCLRNGCLRDPFFNGIKFMTGAKRLVHLDNLRSLLQPWSVRMTVDQVPGFPENFIQPELVDVEEDQRKAVEALYAQVPSEVMHTGAGAPAIVRDLRARQRSEVAKVPIIVEKVEAILEEGRSAAVFMSFLQSITMVRTELKRKGIETREVSGNIKDSDRIVAVDDFQNDRVRVIVNQIDSGGASINMHHTETSKYPRTSLLCPNFSSVSFVQALGRIPRAGGLSKCIQKILLLANTIEERVYRAIERKLKNIEMISDADLKGEL